MGGDSKEEALETVVKSPVLYGAFIIVLIMVVYLIGEGIISHVNTLNDQTEEKIAKLEARVKTLEDEFATLGTEDDPLYNDVEDEKIINKEQARELEEIRLILDRLTRPKG